MIKKPIIGLSPMDGVTDFPFRLTVNKIKKPDLSFTEFVNVEGLSRGALSLLNHLYFDKSESPIFAQIYGYELESFYQVSLIVCALNFDGIDINMGCPAKKVARRFSGAGLIHKPNHSVKIIKTVKKAVKDWYNGISLEEANIRPKIINYLQKFPNFNEKKRKLLPVSVKTRLGIDTDISETWIKILLDTSPHHITLHGRTLKQAYSGESNYESIYKAGQICKNSPTLFLGNGDIKSLSEAKEKIKTLDLDGVLVGRALMGNPWFFKDITPDIKERVRISLLHSENFVKIFPDQKFFNMRKHLAWYIKGITNASDLRKDLMQSENLTDLKNIFTKYNLL